MSKSINNNAKNCKKNNIVASIPVPATSKTRIQQGFQASDGKHATKPATKPAPKKVLVLRTVAAQQPLQISVLHDAFLQKKTSMQLLYPFKNATLYSAGGDLTKRWHIEFYYLYPGSADKFKRFREELGINKIKTIKDRITYGQEAVRFINEKLHSGFNPFTAFRATPAALHMGLISQLTYIKELLSANATASQCNSYKEMFNRISLFIDQHKLHQLSLYDITIKEVREFKQWCLHTRDLTPKTTNNTISHLAMFWDRAIEEQYAVSNPFKLITRARLKDKPVPDDRDVRFEPITDQEMVLIFDGLRSAGQQPFINFLSFVYYAWARPVEILRLRVEDIELERSVIRFKKSKTKNGKSAYVQIVPPLMVAIQKMQLQKFPADHFIFSDEYQPGTRQLSKNAPSRRWHEQVKTKLKIKKDLYALKHTGNIEYLLRNKENINLKWQQLQNRHSSAAMTENYNKRIGAFFIEVKNLNFRIC